MNKPKKLGIIGGMGSRAGLFFLEKIMGYSLRENNCISLDLIFHNNSSIPDRTRAIIYNETSPLPEILKSMALFEQNQIDVIALGCITSYYYYEQISSSTKADVINPLTLIGEFIKENYNGINKVGLLATTGTIKSELFHRELESHGVEVITLGSYDQENLFMRSVYMKNGFKSAIISSTARALMHYSAEKLIEQGANLIIGGCTEVSIGINSGELALPYIDVLDLLANKTVQKCYQYDFVRL